MALLVTVSRLLLVMLGLWLLGEVGIRLYLEHPLRTGFYSSPPRLGEVAVAPLRWDLVD